MKLVLSLLKNEYNNYKAELLNFANYGTNITDMCNCYLENHKNLTETKKQRIKFIIDKTNALVSNIKSIQE